MWRGITRTTNFNGCIYVDNSFLLVNFLKLKRHEEEEIGVWFSAMSSKMIGGVESPVQIPATFNQAQVFSSASSIIISRKISCSNRNKNQNHNFCRFALRPHYASFLTRKNPNPTSFTAFVSNSSFDAAQPPPPDSKPNQVRSLISIRLLLIEFLLICFR